MDIESSDSECFEEREEKSPKRTKSVEKEDQLETLKKEALQDFQDHNDTIEDSIEEEELYKGFKFNTQAIDLAIAQQFKKIDHNVHNKISLIHKSINFYYNSLNLCLGKQGSGKTTFLMKELIKLSALPDHGRYEAIVYVTNGAGRDETFNALVKLINGIPVYNVEFNEIIGMLETFFSNRDESDPKHIFVILEDATFLLLKDGQNNTWGTWMTKLRHLRMTVWINIHVWKSISTSIKTQVTSSFVFRGYNKENVNRIYYQSSIGNVSSQNFYALYQTLRKRQCLKVDNFLGEAYIIN